MPVDDEVAGRPLGESRQESDTADPPSKIGAVVRRAEHHHAIDPLEVFAVGQRHPAPDDEVAETVAHEADPAGLGQGCDHAAERPAVGLEVGIRTRVADQQHGGLERVAEMLGDRPHRRASFAEPMKHQDGRPLHGRHRTPSFEIREGFPALLGGALAHGGVARIENPAAAIGGPLLQSPVVADDGIAPFKRFAGPPQLGEPFGVAEGRRFGLTGPAGYGECEGDDDGGDQRYSFHPHFSSSATTLRMASSWDR